MDTNSENSARACLVENVFQAQSKGKDLPWESIRNLSDCNETANFYAERVNEDFGIGISYQGRRIEKYDIWFPDIPEKLRMSGF